MKKTILEIYALAVCFATIVCFVVALGFLVYDVAQIINPEFTLGSYEHEQHASNDAFWNSHIMPADPWEDRAKERPRPPEHELTKQREESHRQSLRYEQRNASQSLVQSTIIILIDSIVFMMHWRVARRARETT